jgi:lipoprotein-anchoring transpeptidase ErfK/SrfK
MYFTDRGHAIHGAPWVPDDVFGSGTRLSHGCAGLPVGNAEWFFNWTPVGTPVQVRW